MTVHANKLLANAVDNKNRGHLLMQHQHIRRRLKMTFGVFYDDK